MGLSNKEIFNVLRHTKKERAVINWLQQGNGIGKWTYGGICNAIQGEYICLEDINDLCRRGDICVPSPHGALFKIPTFEALQGTISLFPLSYCENRWCGAHRKEK